MNRDYDYWGAPDAETLWATDPDEAIEYILDDVPTAELTGLIIEIVGWRRSGKPTAQKLAPRGLELLLERLDIYYALGDPERATTPTPAMLRAAELFCETVLADYDVWSCVHDMSSLMRVDALKWVRKNRPEWLTEDR